MSEILKDLFRVKEAVFWHFLAILGPIFFGFNPADAQIERFLEGSGRSLLVYSNAGAHNQLHREFIVDKSGSTENLRLVFIEFQYLIDGEVRTVTMSDIKKVDSTETELVLHLAPGGLSWEENQTAFSSAIESIRITIGGSAKVTTTRVKQKNAESVLLEAEDLRTPYERSQKQAQTSEEYFIENIEKSKSLSEKRALKKNNNLVHMFGEDWILDAIARGLVLPLVTNEHDWDFGKSVRIFILNIPAFDFNGTYNQKIITSGNVRDFSQIVSLAALHSQEDVETLLAMKALESNFKSEPGTVINWYQPQSKHVRGIDGVRSMSEVIASGESELWEFWRFNASLRSESSKTTLPSVCSRFLGKILKKITK